MPHLFIKNAFEKQLLTSKIIMEQGLTDSGRISYLLRSCPTVSFFFKHSFCRIHYFLLGVLFRYDFLFRHIELTKWFDQMVNKGKMKIDSDKKYSLIHVIKR